MKLKKGKIKNIIFIAVIVLIFLFSTSFVNAAINDEYGTTTSVSGEVASSAVKKSDLLGLISRLVFALGTLIEWLTSLIFQALTGVNDFPWADKIVFNAVPLLDVNFINPSRGSFVGNSDIKAVISNMYSTILALAVAFFGIVVMITAIKLVISTIAEEKAKYKKAIVDWLVGFVMLFCMHYLISFVFYLNESLVKMASQIAVAQYESAEDKLKAQNSEIAKQIIENMGDTTLTGWIGNLVDADANIIDPLFTQDSSKEFYDKNIADILQEASGMLEAWTNFDANEKSAGLHEMLMKYLLNSGTDERVSEEQQKQRLGILFAWALDENISVTRLREIANNEIIGWRSGCRAWNGEALTDEVVREIFGKYYNQFAFAIADGSALGLYEKNIFGDITGNSTVYNCTSDTSVLKYYYSPSYENDNRHFTSYSEYKKTYSELSETTYIPTIFKANDLSMQLVITERTSQEYIDSIKDTGTYLIPSRGLEAIADKADYKKWYINDTPYYCTFMWHQVLEELIILKSYSSTAYYGEPSYESRKNQGGMDVGYLISNLSQYFKTNAYEREIEIAGEENLITAATQTDNIYPQNMIMFTVLAVQSIILFIAYIKRLFYILLLGLMAPIVVVFDFFQRFGK